MSSRKEQKEQARLERETRERELAASQSRKRRMTIFGGILAVAVVAVVAAVIVSSGAFKSDDVQGATEVNERFAGIAQKGDTLGDPGAPATIFEYADLKCPFCAEFARDGLPQLIDEYIETGKAKIVFRNLTILDAQAAGNDSTDAATMAQAVGLQNKMWQFIDLFYINQKDENTVYATDSFLNSLATAIPGVDVNKAQADRDSAAVKANLTLATDSADNKGVTGTPTFFVGTSEKDSEQVQMDDLSDISPITSAVDALQK